MGKKLTQEQFIERAIEVHGDKYRYDKVVYVNSQSHILIYCKKCKRYFSQIPNNHLRNRGCQYCKGKNKTTEEFIKESIEKHGDKYGYDRVVYVNSQSYILIYCKKCKKYFLQTVNNHLHGYGCSKCGKDKSELSRIKTKDQFVIDARKVHGDKYGYDKVIYINCKKKVKIWCTKCKKYFPQTPDNHLHGYGCPICRESKGEIEVRKYLEKYNIIYVPQKRFDDCRNKRPLPFDFYLSDYNVCIEFQGQQHYEAIIEIFNKKFTVEESELLFKSQQKRDLIKRDYCKNNGIRIIVIPYWDINNIESVLNEQLNTCMIS